MVFHLMGNSSKSSRGTTITKEKRNTCNKDHGHIKKDKTNNISTNENSISNLGDETSSILSASASSLNASGSALQTTGATTRTTIVETYSPNDRDWPYIWALRDGTYIDWKRVYRYSTNAAEEMAMQVTQQLRLPVMINKQLYLGNAASLTQPQNLKAIGITGVLHMAGGSTVVTAKQIRALKSAGIEYESLAAHDQLDYPLLYHHWEDAYEILQRMTSSDKKHKHGGKVLVTCFQGINRSGLIVSAYHMITTKTSVLDTVRHVRHQRGNGALANLGFQEQLVAFARCHDLLGPPPGHAHCFVLKAAPPRSKLLAAAEDNTNNDMDLGQYWTPPPHVILQTPPKGRKGTTHSSRKGGNNHNDNNSNDDSMTGTLQANLKHFLSFK